MRALVLVLLAACGHGRMYEEPAPEEPHAILKFSVTYHAAPGPSLDEDLLLDGQRLAGPELGILTGRRFMRAYRVHPRAASLRARSFFYHRVVVPRTEHYTEYERYPCGTTTSYGSSGLGGTRSSYSTTRYCSRPVSRWRTVYDHRTIPDGECVSQARFTPEAGALYLIQYDFYGHGQCRFQCMRQYPTGGGEFQLSPCS